MSRALKLIVLAVWLLAVAWLVRFEAFPEFFSGSTLSYRILIGQNVLLRESWHKISLKGKDIGYVFTSISSESTESGTAMEIISKIHINLGLPVRTDDIVLETAARLDSSYTITTFESDLKAPGITVRNIVRKLDSGRYMASSFRTDLQAQETQDITLPANAVVFIPPTDLLPPRLRSGVRSYMRVVDPISLSVSAVELETLSASELAAAGLAKSLHWTRLEHKGMDFLCGRNEKDEVIMVKAPLGIMLTKCTVDEAFDAAGIGNSKAPALDLDPAKVAQYVESLVGPLSSVININKKKEKNHD